ncbi:peptidoglycan editing factor PgeF [Pleurocapsales cyanobacterium LEGE 06147]|nr:peptidoglycan editing factor PgeF [Pleurocapsales cyanobacterium LEGE 06147]
MHSSVVSETQAVTPGWQWCDWQGLPYLTCSLLENWQHGFFTQQFYPHTPEELVRVLEPDAVVYRVKQVHGNRVLTPKNIEAARTLQNEETTLPDADGIVTEDKKQAVWVASADCNPVLIGDVETGRVAAVHAGWRGTAQKIVPETIARFLSLGSSLINLRIAIGPAITGEVYQVSELVAAQVGASIISPQEASTTEEILAALKKLPNSPLLDDDKPGRVRLDIKRVNTIQIEKLGISHQQIAIAPYCTYLRSELFFSYRRSKQKKVQWSGIISNGGIA